MIAAGAVVARYEYDAWGNQLTEQIPDSIGEKNPIRYRGYYYDNETGYYYCQSRYYNPEWCRWISADVYMDTQDGIMGTNMYAYCLNDPVDYWDPSGYEPITITAILALIGNGLDALSLVMSISDMINNPSWANAGWLALDVLSAALPIVPAVGSIDNILKGAIKALGKIDDPMDAGKFAKLIAKVMPIGFLADMIIGAKRVGSAASKTDAYHFLGKFLTKADLVEGKYFVIFDAKTKMPKFLLQTLGEVNGKKGVFEFILELNGTVSHQLFKAGKTINGIAN